MKKSVLLELLVLVRVRYVVLYYGIASYSINLGIILEQRNFKRCSIGPLFKSTFFIIVTRLYEVEKRNAYGWNLD